MLMIAFHPAYVHPVREGHRFPMQKYELIPAQLKYEGIVSDEHFFQPNLADLADVCRAHDEDYVRDLVALTLDPRMVRRIGFPLTKELVDRELLLVQGTMDACRYALEGQVAFNVAGGTHHAGRDFGEGFCLLNDQAVAAAYLLDQHFAKRILIIDLDVHQGNGTAHIFENHPSIKTFSMHGEKNYPFVKQNSYLDIGLPDEVSDQDYLLLLQESLENLFVECNPDFVFYQAGVDILHTDKLGRLSLSMETCRYRDQLVFSICQRYAVPVQVSMGGGYSSEIKDIVNAHVNTFRTALEVFGE